MNNTIHINITNNTNSIKDTSNRTNHNTNIPSIMYLSVYIYIYIYMYRCVTVTINNGI